MEEKNRVLTDEELALVSGGRGVDQAALEKMQQIAGKRVNQVVEGTAKAGTFINNISKGARKKE